MADTVAAKSFILDPSLTLPSLNYRGQVLLP
jgi:hypothetical protein